MAPSDPAPIIPPAAPVAALQLETETGQKGQGATFRPLAPRQRGRAAPAPAGGQGAQGAPLGIGTENVSAGLPAQRSSTRKHSPSGSPDPVRRARGLERKFRLLETASVHLPHHRVSWCGRRPLADGVSVLYHPEHASASYGGVAVCGSVWTCPVCAARIAAERARELADGAARWQARGGHLLMLTLTIRHQRLHKLSFLIRALNTAYREIRQGRAFMQFKERFGLVGSVTGREVTEGKSGWHPHLHGLLFVKRYMTVAEQTEMRRWIYAKWEKALKKVGLNATYERGVSLQDIDSDNADYLMKVAEAWNGANETTGALAKEAKRGNRTPQKLLALAAAGDLAAGRRFVEYADATRGLKMIVWSKGLRKELFNTDAEKTDQEIAEEKQADAIELFTLTNWQWQIILKHRLRGELLAECCSGDIDAPVQWLAGWGIELGSWQLKYTIKSKNKE